ncbi:MAG: T9SS type A sorting domain-containing protein, partial [Flavobacteriales bacterium]
VLLYPNPASGTVTLLTRQTKATVQVYNTLGKKVLSDTFSNQDMNRIDVSGLQSGCYTVEVRSEGGLVRLPLNVVN